ncbi:MAG: ArsR family transcriptional regulator [Ilumatobacter sp.]|nr:MAG: ArsR family transcriptional regulator [Ilumatobacter sp.]
MGHRDAKDALFDGFAEVAKALASGRRAELIDVLAQGERHVDELAAEIGQSVANTSFHLRALAGAGLVTTRREGTRIHYRLASERVVDLWVALRDVAAAHHARLDDLAAAYLGDRDELEQVTRDELVRRIAAGEVLVVDVRPAAEYRSGHIAGARSVPVDDLTARLAELLTDVPDGAEIVAYCRGPYCAYADDAVRALLAGGRSARRLEDGFPEWRRAGLAVESATSGARPG